MISNIVNWFRMKMFKGAPRDSLIEPSPVQLTGVDGSGVNELQRTWQSMLDSLKVHRAEIQNDIDYYTKRKQTSIQDRRHLKHLYEELHAIDSDIASAEAGYKQEFPTS